jgi:hypothetical protein
MKYALFGYTYQHAVACLLLAMMDVERKIENITLEATVEHNFDDITLQEGGEMYFLQIKDIEQAKIDELIVSQNQIKISGKWHKLSCFKNLLFFKDIKIKADCKVIGFSAQLKDGVYIISLSRANIEKRIASIYRKDLHRLQLINKFLSEKLDERKLEINITHLPAISTFDTRLTDKSIRLARKILDFERILHIEGKPGVGKSHLVAQLEKEFGSTVLYRFWISNQDKYHKERLRFDNFEADLIKKLFFDQKERSEHDILEKLGNDEPTLIIDGLDHVENYHPEDLTKYINFINHAAERTKVVVLSRPLKVKLDWEKQSLQNWNSAQTKKILKAFYHITEYDVAEEIYKLSEGYPILVKYLAEEYKITGIVPQFSTLNTVNDYYDQLFLNESGKQALSLFLCCTGFIMQEEIGLFLDSFGEGIVKEFVRERPYLFERKLNRITLYHDSLITYLRQSGVSYLPLQEKVNDVVSRSLLTGETRFQSRISHFDLSKDSCINIVRYYANIKRFKSTMSAIVDFEAIREFHSQLLEIIAGLDPVALSVHNYYDIALLVNLSTRDHLSMLNGFHYTFLSELLREGYEAEHITSSGYLFGMLMFITSKDASMMYNLTEDRMYDTSRFYKELDQEIKEETQFFDYQSRPFNVVKMDKALNDLKSLHYKDNLVQILVNLYLFPQNNSRMIAIREAFLRYIQGEQDLAARKLTGILRDKDWDDYRFLWLLGDAKAQLLALGQLKESNDYLKLSLQSYLQKKSSQGSLSLWPEVLAYLRLALHQNRKIDITSISAFYLKYYQRHDYSLRSIPYALCLLEERGYIHWKDSLLLVMEIQTVSEKGYRGLTQEYLGKHNPDFMIRAIDEFGYDQLKVSWFDMEVDFLEALPEHIFDLEMHAKFRFNRHDNEMEITQIGGLLETSKIGQLKTYLDYYRFLITISTGDPKEQILKQYKIPYKVKAGNNYKQPRDPEESFQEGYFDADNAHVALEKGLSPVEVARLNEADSTAITFPEIFEVFPTTILKTYLLPVLHAALTWRSRYGSYPKNPRLLPGNLLKLISIWGFEDIDCLLESFKIFMDLSMYPLPLGKAISGHPDN